MSSVLDLDPDLLRFATDAERAEIQKAADVAVALESPLAYAERVEPGLIRPFRHTQILNEYAVALVEHRLYPDGIGPAAVWEHEDGSPEEGVWVHPDTGTPAHDILVISIPPRHGKSLLLTETLPAWFISKYPTKKAILTGYGANLARGFSKKNRDKITPAGIPGVSLDRTTQAADEWGLDNGKGMVVSAGAGGTITGKGADLLVIDDPVKNQEDALSETYHQKMWDWWISTAKSRVQKGGVTLIIQTRWHEDDLAGKVSRNERCFTLNIPALAFEGNPDPEDGVARDPETDERDPLGRRPGEALCPALQTRTRLEELRSGADGDEEGGPQGALWFSCLYQGKPSVRGGGILPGPFPRFTSLREAGGVVRYTLHKESGGTEEWTSDHLTRFITADLAISTKTRADWTVFSLWGWTPAGQLLLLDMYRDRIESPDHERKAREFWDKCRAEHGTVRFFGIEDRTFGTSLIQAMVRGGGIQVRPLKADTDKETRALSAAGPMMVAGRLFFPGAEWVRDFIRECEAFPNGSHDDMVDTLSYAGLVGLTLPRKRVREERQEETYSDRVIRQVNSYREKAKGLHPVLGKW